MQFFDEQGENIQLDLSQKIVAIGIPSIGNVGQLAVDVLVSTMNASRIGSFDAGNLVVEMVGNDPYLSANSLAGELHTAMEVFEIKETNIVLVLVRSPITQAQPFAHHFVQWCRSCKCSKLLVLSSANASWNSDELIKDLEENVQSTIRVCCTGNYWSTVAPFAANITMLANDKQQMDQYVCGTGKWLLKEAELAQDMSAALILVICNEGDNSSHGIYLAHTVAKYALQLFPADQKVQWKMPHSWCFMYGKRYSQSLY